ncbi:MAG: hypothetical protein KF742_06450 [Cryobacterium sp.]|nr:hypothetical protein [Cryobacterium sp.]
MGSPDIPDPPIVSMATLLWLSGVDLYDRALCGFELRKAGLPRDEILEHIDLAMSHARELSEGQERAA